MGRRHSPAGTADLWGNRHGRAQTHIPDAVWRVEWPTVCRRTVRVWRSHAPCLLDHAIGLPGYVCDDRKHRPPREQRGPPTRKPSKTTSCDLLSLTESPGRLAMARCDSPRTEGLT